MSIQKNIIKLLLHVSSDFNKLYNHVIDELTKATIVSTERVTPEELYKISKACTPTEKERVQALLDSYKQALQSLIQQGITRAVMLSTITQQKAFEAYTRMQGEAVDEWRNKTANAFIRSRRDRTDGLNLSDRVWNYTQQTKAEFELAMSNAIENGIKKGESAESLGRKIRQHLNNPDMMYRRYHVKKAMSDGTKKDVIEWRRRVVDEDGNVHFVKEDLAKVGTGVYRSARQNALRLTITETNMAYNFANCERWSSEPFVLGIRIRLSGNHPEEDICDELAGDYPKDFMWRGWHPRCMCSASSILIDRDSEEWKYLRSLPEKEYKSYKSPNLVQNVPEKFSKWCERNAKKLDLAREKGKLPYFVKDNERVVGNLLGWEEKQATKSMSSREKILAAAKARHEARTEKQIENILTRWENRKKTIAENNAIKHFGDRILRYMDGIKDVDVSKLRSALKTSDYKQIYSEATELKMTGKQILSLSRLDDPMKVAREYSMADAVAVNNAVESRLARVSADLSSRKAFLEKEIKWVEEHKKYDTWKVAQNAYKKELAIVENKIQIKTIIDSVEDALVFASTSRSKIIKIYANEMKDALSARHIDLKYARNVAEKLNDKYEKLKVKGSINKLTQSKPATLQEINEAIYKYKYVDANLKKNEVEINKRMKHLIDSNDFGMDINADLLQSVFDRGFLNTFEVGKSNGYNGSSKTAGLIEQDHKRLVMSHKMFLQSTHKDLLSGKYVGKQLQRYEYEKYGHLLDNNKYDSIKNNLTWYGNTQVRFKKNKVLCTWTFNDSLHTNGEYFQPSLTTDPKVESFDKMYHKNPLEEDKWDSLYRWQRNMGTSYVELQYHGKVTIDMVESITFQSNPEEWIEKSLIKKFQDKGIELWYLKNDKVVKY